MRFVFHVPGITFDRAWQIGRVVFRPAGVVAGEVADRSGQKSVHSSWAAAHELASDVVGRWAESATVETEAESIEAARTGVADAMAVLRFLLRGIVNVNVDIHRIGLPGEVDKAILEYLVLYEDQRVAPGGIRVDGPVEFRFTDQCLGEWDGDAGIRWLHHQLELPEKERCESGNRLVTALKVLDRAFLTKDSTIRVILYAVAVEVLFSDRVDAAGETKTSSLRIAARVAYLTCPVGCARSTAACPYVLGFRGRKHLWDTAEKWAKEGEWRCSAFLDIARPPDMDSLFPHRSVFGARNEAVHEGTTSVDESDVGWLRTYAERTVRAYLDWAATRGKATISDLDAEILDGAAVFGEMTPGAV